MELKHIAVRSGRLSAILREDMGLSASLMNKLKWQDRLFVDGIPQHTDYQVQAGNTVSVLMDEPEPAYPAESGPLTVLYEDEFLLAVDKPPGLLIHPSRHKNTGTLANFVAGYYQKTGQRSAFHPVTRLDRDTFGVVLLSKSAHVHARMQNTPVEKTYHALVWGGPEKEEGVIDAPIARRPLPSLLRYVNQDGKPSQTRYRVLQRESKLSKLALIPVTGRTHQLRVHCSYMGFPIAGDPQYGPADTMGYPCQQLCARTVRFVHPITGEEMTVTSTMDVKIEE